MPISSCTPTEIDSEVRTHCGTRTVVRNREGHPINPYATTSNNGCSAYKLNDDSSRRPWNGLSPLWSSTKPHSFDGYPFGFRGTETNGWFWEEKNSPKVCTAQTFDRERDAIINFLFVFAVLLKRLEDSDDRTRYNARTIDFKNLKFRRHTCKRRAKHALCESLKKRRMIVNVLKMSVAILVVFVSTVYKTCQYVKNQGRKTIFDRLFNARRTRFTDVIWL